MEKRAFERIPTNIKVKFNYNNSECSGSITNLSEKGMFISTIETSIPFDFQFQIPVSLKDRKLHISVKLNRIIISPDSNGIGVELTNPSQEYLDFVRSLKTSI